MSATAGHMRAVAPDMPGFGRADRPATFDYPIEGYSRHLAGLLEQLQVERAHLVLHDWGRHWGLAWAAANPDRLASLTLINVGALPGYRWLEYARLWRTPGLRRAVLPAGHPQDVPVAAERGQPAPVSPRLPRTACSMTRTAAPSGRC